MATGCESQRWGTLADPRPGRGHGDEWIDCVGSMSASPHPVDDYLLLSKSAPVIPRYGHQMYAVFLWETWLEKQTETTEGYLSSERGMSRLITDHRARSRVWASFLYMHCEPQEFFVVVVVSAVLHFTSFPLSFFFLLYSRVPQTLKNVGPLDCNLRLLRRRSLGGKISVAGVMHLLTLNVFSANFHVVLVVVAFFLFSFFFIHFLSYVWSFLYKQCTSSLPLFQRNTNKQTIVC